MVIRSIARSQAALWLFVLPVLSRQLTVPCESGWSPNPEAGTCLKIYDDQKSWWDAYRSCMGDGAEMVVVHDVKGINFVKDLLTLMRPTISALYINMRQVKANTWITEIEENEDENTNPSYTCGTVSDKFFITYVPCSTKENYICEKKPGFCPDEWITSASSGTCIRLFTGNKSTWAEARKNCQRENGDLVAILDKDTNEIIGNELSVQNENYAFIGLNDKRSEGWFKWLDFNDKVEYSHWASNEPSKSTPQKDCTVITTGVLGDSSWSVEDCEQKKAFVCEMFSDCKNEQYGMLCPMDCGPTNCAKQACNPRTLVCKEGCKSGFVGSKCDAPAGLSFFAILGLVTVVLVILIGLSAYLMKPKLASDVKTNGREGAETQEPTGSGNLATV